MPEQKVGIITHCFHRIGVAVVKATDGELCLGDTIHIKGEHTDFVQTVESLQVEHQAVSKLPKGGEAGLKVNERVHERDIVYKVVP